jgi:hypothetical protein
LAVFGKDPEFTMREDLRRFKALIEMHEIPTTEGQPHGPRSTAVSVDALQPEKRKPSEHYAGERTAAQRRAS